MFKPYHEHDTAIQWFIISRHLPIGRGRLVHVDTNYIYKGEIEVDKLLAVVDISERVLEIQPGIESSLASIAEMLASTETSIAIGMHCDDPHECDFKNYCWRKIPRPSFFDLCRLKAETRFRLFSEGRVTYADLRDREWTAVQRMQIETGLSGEPHIDADRIAPFLASAEYPINFLDFETQSSAVPHYDGQQPYAQIPFQYSLHILQADGKIEHREFLADENTDPRPALVERLVADVTVNGTIVAFNKSFEQAVIARLASRFAGRAEVLGNMNECFIDLIMPFREFMYYYPDFNGSFSIKAVLPAMFPNDDNLNYSRLDIQAGDMAMASYRSLERVDDEDQATTQS